MLGQQVNDSHIISSMKDMDGIHDNIVDSTISESMGDVSVVKNDKPSPMIVKRIDLSDLTIFANVNRTIAFDEDQFPIHVFVRNVKPVVSGWKYLGEINNPPDDEWYTDEPLNRMYELIEFNPRVLTRGKYRLKTDWEIEIGFWEDVNEKRRPTGESIKKIRVTLWKADTGDDDFEIPDKMMKYLEPLDPVESHVDDRENDNRRSNSASNDSNSDVPDILSKFSGKEIIELARLGVINLDNLIKGSINSTSTQALSDDFDIIDDVDEDDFDISDDGGNGEIINDIGEPGFVGIIKNISDLVNAASTLLPMAKQVLQEMGIIKDSTKEKEAKILAYLVEKIEELERKVEARDREPNIDGPVLHIDIEKEGI